jgi:hypothetical protein
MIRTQIQLDDKAYNELRHVALRQHRSMAACIRDAIAAFLKQVEPEKDDLSDIAGKFQPMSMDGVKDHDRHWAEAALHERPRT